MADQPPNKDNPDPNNPTWMTELDHTHGEGTNKDNDDFTKYSKYIYKDGVNTKMAQRLEDEPIVWNDAAMPLPLSVPHNGVCNAVAKTMPFDSVQQRTQWEKRFQSGKLKAIAQDFFWYVMVERFIQGDGLFRGVNTAMPKERRKEIKDKLFERIANNYSRILFNPPSATKELMLLNYSDALAQATYHSFYIAYPKSRMHFTPEFKHWLIDTISEWTVGMRPSQIKIDHWSKAYDKGRGNKPITRLKDKVDKADHLSTVGSLRQRNKERPAVDRKQSSTKLSSFKSDTVSVRRTLHHSPLVEHFLKMHSVSKGKSNMYSMTFSEDASRPLNRHSSTTTKKHNIVDATDTLAGFPFAASPIEDESKAEQVTTYYQVVESANNRRQNWMNKFSKEKEKLCTEVKAIKQQTKQECKRLNDSHKRALRGDVHEYSNFLLSSWMVENE